METAAVLCCVASAGTGCALEIGYARARNANGLYEAVVASERSPQQWVCAKGFDRIGRVTDCMGRSDVHRLVVILIGNLVAMPALQESQRKLYGN